MRQYLLTKARLNAIKTKRAQHDITDPIICRICRNPIKVGDDIYSVAGRRKRVYSHVACWSGGY